MVSTLELTSKKVASLLKASDAEVLAKLESLISQNKADEKKIANLKAEIAKLKSADLFSKPINIGEFEVYAVSLDNVAPNDLRSMGDELKAKGDNVIAVLSSVMGDKANFAAVCGKGAIAKGVKAGNLVKEVASIAGGGGGGRPDSAMAGAKNIDAVPEAIGKVESIIKNMLGE